MRATKKTALIGTLIVLIACSTTTFVLAWPLNVEGITTAELANWLNDKTRTAPLLLDVRSQAEFAVSHLANAQQVDPDAAATVVKQEHDRPIVTYCSVGYRSGNFAGKLRAAGFTNVRNLEGSIFRWANEGRPVLRGAVRVEQVHPYNTAWGLLLAKKYRAPVPVP